MMMTKSPMSMWDAKVALCLPRSRIAVWLARRPRTTSVASMTCHWRLISPGFGVYVRTVFASFLFWRSCFRRHAGCAYYLCATGTEVRALCNQSSCGLECARGVVILQPDSLRARTIEIGHAQRLPRLAEAVGMGQNELSAACRPAVAQNRAAPEPRSIPGGPVTAPTLSGAEHLPAAGAALFILATALAGVALDFAARAASRRALPQYAVSSPRRAWPTAAAAGLLCGALAWHFGPA